MRLGLFKHFRLIVCGVAVALTLPFWFALWGGAPASAQSNANPPIPPKQDLESTLNRLQNTRSADRPNPNTQAETLYPTPTSLPAPNYRQYWQKTQPLRNMLAHFTTQLEASNGQSTITLQEVAALGQTASLLYQQLQGQLSPAQRQYSSNQLMGDTVAQLQQAASAWRLQAKWRNVYRTKQVQIAEDAYLLRLYLLKARGNLAELNRLEALQQAVLEPTQSQLPHPIGVDTPPFP